MWLTVIHALTASYLIAGSLLINASSNLPSRIAFKVIPMALGLPMAFGVFALLLGWPL